MEMLSEATPSKAGWKATILTGRHGLLNTYEAFVHIIDSMYNQHAQMARKGQARNRLACSYFISESTDHVARLASGSQRLHARRSRFLDVVSNKSAKRLRVSICRRTRTRCLSVADHLPAQSGLCQRNRFPISSRTWSISIGCGRGALYEGNWNLGLGQH